MAERRLETKQGMRLQGGQHTDFGWMVEDGGSFSGMGKRRADTKDGLGEGVAILGNAVAALNVKEEPKRSANWRI